MKKYVNIEKLGKQRPDYQRLSDLWSDYVKKHAGTFHFDSSEHIRSERHEYSWFAIELNMLSVFKYGT